jgi:hypothetical protein
MSWESRLFIAADTIETSTVLSVLEECFTESEPGTFALPPATHREERTDCYVALPSAEFGLKFRDQRVLELKQRTDTFAGDADADATVATAEQWTKARVPSDPGLVKQFVTGAVDHAAFAELAAVLRRSLGDQASDLCALLNDAEVDKLCVVVRKSRWATSISKKASLEVAELELLFSDGRPPQRVLSLCVENVKPQRMSERLVRMSAALRTSLQVEPLIGGYPTLLRSLL